MGNFEPPTEEPRSGPGEGGKAHILPADQRNEASQSISEFGMNTVCFDEISLSRSIFDTRVKERVLLNSFVILFFLISLAFFLTGVNTGITLKNCLKPVLLLYSTMKVGQLF